MKTGHKACNCIFCCSKCPECGSTDVIVNFNLGFKYENCIENRLELERTFDQIDMDCNECGASLYGFEVAHLEVLLETLKETMKIPSGFEASIDDEGKIHVSHIP